MKKHKQCLICNKNFQKSSKESFKQFELRKHCSVRCQAQAREGIRLSDTHKKKISSTKLSQKRRMSKQNKYALIKANTGRKQTPEHIRNSLRARGFSEEVVMLNKEKRHEYRYFYNLKRMFNLTKEEYEKMLIKQNGVCAICNDSSKNTRRLSVDHCHKTGNIRGLLCVECNTALGLVKDEVDILENMIKYLKNI